MDKACEIVRKQLALLANFFVTEESKLSTFRVDSPDTVEIVIGLEKEFGISVKKESAQSIFIILDAANLIEKLYEKNRAQNIIAK